MADEQTVYPTEIVPTKPISLGDLKAAFCSDLAVARRTAAQLRDAAPVYAIPSTRTMDADTRKNHPLYSGVLRYFPDALLAVAHLSKVGNDQHNPGQPLHWAKEKSTDHPDCLLRHLIDAGTLDTDGVRHTAKVAWRALAMLQIEIETERAQSAQPPSGPTHPHVRATTEFPR